MRHSLRLRLLLAGALAIMASLLIAGIVLTSLFAGHVERETVRTLTNDLNRLAALVDAGAPALALTQPMSDPRFDVPYGGIYWQIRDPATGAMLRSRSTWDRALEYPPLGTSGDLLKFSLVDPEGAPATGIGRVLTFDLDGGGTRALELVVAEDIAGTQRAVESYRSELALALLVLGAILLLATWAQVTLGLVPLNALRRGVAAIRAGTASSLTGSYPSEVQPLVAEVNDLTTAQELSIQFARERAADLAHGLKGQLQVLNAAAHEIRLEGNAARAQAIEELSTAMAETIDHQLRLSRLRRRSRNRDGGADFGRVAGRVVITLRKTSRGQELDWRLNIEAGARVSLDDPDLSELLGILLENAAKWAATRVDIAARDDGQLVHVSIEDDGPGLEDWQIKRLGQRGARLDEARSGSGIGISIAHEVVALNDGSMRFSRSDLGGLRVDIELPIAARAA